MLNSSEAIILNYWNREWQSVTYFPTKGKAYIRWLCLKTKNTVGWAYRFRRKWYAVWRQEGEIVFQASNKRWSLTNEKIRFHNEEISSIQRKFFITLSKETVFELVYEKDKTKFWNINDITYDDIDEEYNDFFLWLTNIQDNPGWI